MAFYLTVSGEVVTGLYDSRITPPPAGVDAVRISEDEADRLRRSARGFGGFLFRAGELLDAGPPAVTVLEPEAAAPPPPDPVQELREAVVGVLEVLPGKSARLSELLVRLKG